MANWVQARCRFALATQTHLWNVGALSASGFRPPACQLVVLLSRFPLCEFDRYAFYLDRNNLWTLEDLEGSDSANTRFATACSKLVPEVEQVPLKLGPIPRGAYVERAGLCTLSDSLYTNVRHCILAVCYNAWIPGVLARLHVT